VFDVDRHERTLGGSENRYAHRPPIEDNARMAESFPAASGTRAAWGDIPAAVREEIEAALGAPVVDAVSQPGGFSPGVASRVVLADGKRAFVKAASPHPNPDTPHIHRREARVAGALPADVPAPRLRHTIDDGDWVALVFDDVEGATPELPWRARDLARVLDALDDMARALTPSPIAVNPASEWLTRIFGGWEAFTHDDTRLPDPCRARLEALADLESRWGDAVAGETLLHLDVRADNLLLTADRVFVVDWPWAAVGAAWVDLAAMLPSVAMQGGGDPEEIFRAHPVARDADAARVDAYLAALAGFLMWHSCQPPPPGLPTLRPFQAAQAEHALAWLARRRGWS
jgi:aminoglycoside phosphotransferase (APT) family kinase protein